MTSQQIRSAAFRECDIPELTALQKGLLQAGTRILNSDDVRAFQAQRLAQEKAKIKRAKFWIIAVVAAVAAVLSASTLCAVYLLVCEISRRDLFMALVWLASSMLLGKSAAIFAGMALRVEDNNLAQELAWRTIRAGKCLGGKSYFTTSVTGAGLTTPTLIPAEGLARMTAISRTGVSAEFLVEQLDVDPFLWVKRGHEHYCIAVWDERGFIQ